MTAPEDTQQLFVRERFGIVIDLNCLRMISYLFVGRVRRRSSRIADAGTDHAFKKPEPGIRSPKSAKCKGRGLKNLRSAFIQRRPKSCVRLLLGEEQCKKKQRLQYSHLSHLQILCFIHYDTLF